MPNTIKTITSYTQSEGDVEVLTPSFHDSVTQVSFATDSTVGTVAIYARYHKDANEEVVYDEDGTTALVVDLTDLKTFQLFDKWVYSFVFKPTSVDVSYTPIISSGEVYRTYGA